MRYLSILFLLLASACHTTPTAAPTAAPRQPDPSPTVPAATAAPPTATPAPTAAPTPTLLYSDDFSDPNSGWEVYNQFDGYMNYENGRYRMNVRTAPALFWVTAPGPLEAEGQPQKLADVILEAQVAWQEGEEGEFGLLCRLNEPTYDSYTFLINNRGEFGVFYNYDFIQRDYLSPGLTPHPAIHSGTAVNHLQVICQGSQLTFLVNGEVVFQGQDDRLTEAGYSGLVAGSLTRGGVDVYFDDFRLLAP